MSDRLVGPAQLVSAAILGSVHPGPTSTDHAHRWSLAMSQRRLLGPSSPSDCLMVDPCARQTRRAACVLPVLGHGVGGWPGERLAARLGLAAKRSTILRHLIRHQRLPDHSVPRADGIVAAGCQSGYRSARPLAGLHRAGPLVAGRTWSG